MKINGENNKYLGEITATVLSVVETEAEERTVILEVSYQADGIPRSEEFEVHLPDVVNIEEGGLELVAIRKGWPPELSTVGIKCADSIYWAE